MLVIGATTTAVRLVDELLRSGEQVVLIAPSSQESLHADLSSLACEVIETAGSVREPELLRGRAEVAEAVVVLGFDDVRAIQVALAVEELNPQARLVLELANPNLGTRLAPLLGDCRVLSSAALAAPSFVSSVLAAGDVHTFELGGRLVAAGPSERIGGERLSVLGDSTRSGIAAVLPDEGDIVLGTQVVGDAPPVRTSGWRGALSRTFDRRVRIVLIGLVVLIALSLLYFRLAGQDWWHAVYLALTTSTQTGDTTDLEALPLALKFGAVLIQLFGLVLSAGVTAVIVDLLISSRIAALTGGVRGKPRHHVVVCGLGRIGTAVATRLQARGVQLVAIEANEDGLGVRRARRMKIPVIIAEGTDHTALEQAGIARADGVLALTDNDAANLEIALVAKEANPGVRVVTRLYDHELAGRVEKRLQIGPTRSVSMLAAPAFAAAALGRRTETIVPVGRRVLLFTELRVYSNAGADTVIDPDLVDAPGRARLLAVDHGSGWSWDVTRARVRPGDRIAVAATRHGLARILRVIKQPMATDRPQNDRPQNETQAHPPGAHARHR